MSFRFWLEANEMLNDPVAQAVLGVVAQDQSLDDDQKEAYLSRPATDFSNAIQHKLKELGVVKNLAQTNPQLYDGIIDGIDHGMTVKDIIDKIRGRDFAPNANIIPKPIAPTM